MKTKDIFEFIQDNFVPNRTNLIPLLKKVDVNDKTLLEIFDGVKALGRPFEDRTGFNEKTLENINSENPDLENLGDISDIYIVLLNKELNDTNFDFEDDKEYWNCELHYAKIWINWFLPVYYIETIYDNFYEDDRIMEIGRLIELDKFEIELVNKIRKIIEIQGFSLVDSKLIHQKITGARTDCSFDTDATIFDCLFSDAITDYPFKLIKRKRLKEKDDLNSFFIPELGDVYYIRRDTFDENGFAIDSDVVDLIEK